MPRAKQNQAMSGSKAAAKVKKPAADRVKQSTITAEEARKRHGDSQKNLTARKNALYAQILQAVDPKGVCGIKAEQKANVLEFANKWMDDTIGWNKTLTTQLLLHNLSHLVEGAPHAIDGFSYSSTDIQSFLKASPRPVEPDFEAEAKHIIAARDEKEKAAAASSGDVKRRPTVDSGYSSSDIVH